MKTNQLQKRHFKSNDSLLKLLVSSLFLFGVQHLQAAEVEKEFYLGAEVQHLSNPSFEESNKKPVTVFKIEPAVNLSMATELNKLYLKSLLAIYRNSNEDVLPNRENPTLIVGWERTLSSGLFGLEAEYNETAALTEQINRLGQSTGNNVDNQTRTKKISGKWDHDFNSKVSMKNEVRYSDVSYSESTPFLVDYTLAGLRSKLIYHNSEIFSTYGLLGYDQYSPDNSNPKTRIARYRLGVISTPLDGLEIDANGGFYKTTGFSSETGFEGEIVGKYERDRISYTLGLSRLLVPSGVSDFQKTDALALGVKYLMSDLETLGADYTHTRNKTENQIVSTVGTVRNQSVGVFYARSFKDWEARATAKFIALDVDGSNRYGNEIGVSLIYGPLSF
ncbi:MAG: hypothetical protein WAX04_04735 [Oscillospiraceae bacterium]